MVNKKQPTGMNLSDKPEKKKENDKKQSSLFQRFNKKTFLIGSTSVIALGALFVGTNVQAQESIKETVNTVSVKVMKTKHSSDFERKDELSQNETIKSASDEAMTKITSEWTDNSAEQIREEIDRQREAGFEVYVVQWGDTLEILAEVLHMSVDELVEINNISDRHMILTGDLLDGVLYQTTNSDRIASATDDSDENLSDANLDGVNVEEEDTSSALDDGYHAEILLDGTVIEEGDFEWSDEDLDLFEQIILEDDEITMDEIDKDDLVAMFGEQRANDIITKLKLKDVGNTSETKEEEEEADDNDNVDDVEVESPEVDTPMIELFGEDAVDDVDESEEDVEDIVVGGDPTTPDKVPVDLSGERSVESTTLETSLNDIPFEKQEVKDPELAYGETVVDTVGVNGVERTEVERIVYSNGDVDENKKDTEVIVKPVAEITRVGVEGVEDEDGEFLGETFENVVMNIDAYETEYIDDDSLDPGEEVFEAHGVNGYSWSHVEFTTDADGEVVNEKILEKDFEGEFEDETYEAVKRVDEVIRRGPEIKKGENYDEIKEETVTETIKHGEVVEEIEADKPFDLFGEPLVLKSNEEYVHDEGQDGEREVTYDVYYLKGEEQFRIPKDIQDNHVEFTVNPIQRLLFRGVKK